MSGTGGPGDAQERYDDIVQDLVNTHSDVVSGKMFGMPCVKSRGKAFAGFYRDAMAFKLSGAAHSKALALPGARLFDPSGRGRPMHEWVEVPSSHAAEWPALAEHALGYVAGER